MVGNEHLTLFIVVNRLIEFNLVVIISALLYAVKTQRITPKEYARIIWKSFNFSAQIADRHQFVLCWSHKGNFSGERKR